MLLTLAHGGPLALCRTASPAGGGVAQRPQACGRSPARLDAKLLPWPAPVSASGTPKHAWHAAVRTSAQRSHGRHGPAVGVQRGAVLSHSNPTIYPGGRQSVYNEELFFLSHDDYVSPGLSVRIMNIHKFMNSKARRAGATPLTAPAATQRRRHLIARLLSCQPGPVVAGPQAACSTKALPASPG